MCEMDTGWMCNAGGGEGGAEQHPRAVRWSASCSSNGGHFL